MLGFAEPFLERFCRALSGGSVPIRSGHRGIDLHMLPGGQPSVHDLFRSIIPCFSSKVGPSSSMLGLGVVRKVCILLGASEGLCTSLFSFISP